MPPGYRNRVTVLLDEPSVRISPFTPADFIIAQLRRGTDEDLTDAAWIASRFRIPTGLVRAATDTVLAPPLKTLHSFSSSIPLIDSSPQRNEERHSAFS